MINIDKKSVSKKDYIDVRFFYENVKNRFQINLISDESGLSRKIFDQNLHRPGLALAGFVELFSYNRVQIVGNTEMRFLAHLDEKGRYEAFSKLFEFQIPCIILTDNNSPFKEMLELANKYNIPLFSTSLSTTKSTFLIGDFLDDQFAPRVSIHGSFVDVYGVGILFVGKSGIGKSEVALDLVERGHRLVADDIIILTKKGENILMGSGTELVKHFMEIRGLGFLNIEKVFGIRAIRYQKRLEVIVELENWVEGHEYTRTGLDDDTFGILEVDIPYIKLPIIPGKNITVISEVIALQYLLKHYGYDSAKIFTTSIASKIREKTSKLERGVNYFEHDFE